MQRADHCPGGRAEPAIGPAPGAAPIGSADAACCRAVLIASARTGSLAAGQTLKISHQFPGGTIDEVDFRDRLCQKFAAELEKRTNGAETAQVYPHFLVDENGGAIFCSAQGR